MAKNSMTPNKAEYDKLCASNKTISDLTLVRTCEATWLIVDSMTQAEFLAEQFYQEVWHGWEDMLRKTTHDALKTVHKLAWPDYKIGKAQMTKEGLCILIWNYRISKAIDNRREAVKAENPNVKNSLQRASSIAGRVYTIIKPSADAKKFTSPAGLACLKIIKDTCGSDGFCLEGDLKLKVMERAAEITPKTDSAWRFLQFYRPLLVESELITYKK